MNKWNWIYSRFFLFIPDFILNSRILPSWAPTNHPTILLDIFLANLNGIFFFISWVNKRNKYVLGVISVRKKKHSEQIIKVHMVIVLNVIDERKKTNLGEKAQKNHDTNNHNKHVIFQAWLVLERSKF